ncbi:hypothetical protein H9P43_008900 [Blastocladiella emersonii ATCC 22665]|nr:hypothetical protein H9P43_008900 [Blastocladiella emersonii ATCC 22665]
MFIYLSKKISIPNDTQLHALGWENSPGWVCCGGEQALLKVLKLQEAPPPAAAAPAAPAPGNGGKSGGAAPQAPASLSLSQTLEGHSGTVVKVAWNDTHTKLTTADSNGMIIVWVLYKGMWYEEMVNDRAKATVADLQWSRAGDKIAIAYTDGNIIVGGVEGNRILGKDLGSQLTHVAWSPDAAFLLFATADGALKLFDAQANYLHKVPLYAGEGAKVVAIDWHAASRNYMAADRPCLAIALDNGKLQINRHERDPRPVLLDTNMQGLVLKWDPTGTVLAVGGHQRVKGADGAEKPLVVVQLYTAHGAYIRYLKVPQGKVLRAVTWEAGGLRLALAVDSAIYFCNLHPEYVHAHIRNALVYAPRTGNDTLTYWDYKAGARVEKAVPGLAVLASNREHVAVVSQQPRTESAASPSGTQPAAAESTDRGFVVCVTNAVGTPLDTRSLGWVAPRAACMTANFVLVTDGTFLVYFPYQLTGTASALGAMLWARESQVKVLHVDSASADDVTVLSATAPSAPATSDPVVAMARSADDAWLFLARASGAVVKFAVPAMSRVAECALALRPYRIHANADGSVASVVDLAGVLRLVSFPATDEKPKLLDLERKDVWSVAWSDDDRDTYAIMEKTRMYVMRGLAPEEPVAATGYLVGFHDLEVTMADLDAIVAAGSTVSRRHVTQRPTRALRDTAAILAQVGLPDALSFVEAHPHPRLWRPLADAALDQAEWATATACMVRTLDYAGIAWTKQVASWTGDPAKQRAAVVAYLGNPAAAEQMYVDMDRRDLAVQLRVAMGDAARVVQLGKAGGADDAVIETCWAAMGRDAMAQHRWSTAASYLAQARDFDTLAECHFYAEDVAALDALARALPVTATGTLDRIGEYLARLGMAREAVYAFTKRGAPAKAMAVCLSLNQWFLAAELAAAAPQSSGAMAPAAENGLNPATSTTTAVVDASFARMEQQLRARGDGTQLVSLYRSANQCLKAARILMDAARAAAARATVDPIQVKKLFVLAALEVERHHAQFGSGTNATSPSPVGGGDDEEATRLLLAAPWRGAEAYHYYLLAQRQYYMGDAESALRTAMALRGYDDVLGTRTVHSLVALLAYKSRNYQACSRALAKLQGGSDDADEANTYEAMAVHIFTNHPVTDFASSAQVPCATCSNFMSELDNACSECHTTYPVCIASGRVLGDPASAATCAQCKHAALEAELAMCSACPLCHAAL